MRQIAPILIVVLVTSTITAVITYHIATNPLKPTYKSNVIQEAMPAKKLPSELNNFIKYTKDFLSALEAGLNYEKYSDMVVQLNINANKAIEALDEYPNFQTNIKDIIKCYIKAREYWGQHISLGKQVELWIISDPKTRSYYQPDFDRYPFLVKAETVETYESKRTYFSLMEAVKLLWAEGAQEIYDLQTYAENK